MRCFSANGLPSQAAATRHLCSPFGHKETAVYFSLHPYLLPAFLSPSLFLAFPHTSHICLFSYRSISPFLRLDRNELCGCASGLDSVQHHLSEHQAEQVLDAKPRTVPSTLRASLVFDANLVFLLTAKTWKLIDGLLNDAQGRSDLSLGDDQWRSQPYDILVSRFGLDAERQSITSFLWHMGCGEPSPEVSIRSAHQQTLVLHQHAEIPGAMSARLALINYDSIQQASPTDDLDDGTVDCLQSLPKNQAKLLCTLYHFLLSNQLESTDSNC